MSYWQLQIDSTLFDSREIGASTIAGTVMGVGDEETGTVVEEQGREIRLPLRIHVAADSGADLASRTADVLDALAEVTEHGFTLLDEEGAEHVIVDPADFESVEFEATRIIGPDGERSRNVIEAVLVATRFDSGVGDGSSSWTYERNSSGRALVVGRITARTRAQAVAIAAPMWAGTARPIWMSSAFRVVGDTGEFDAVAGNPTTIPDDNFRPATVPVVFEQMPAWAASDSRFDAARRIELTVQAQPQRPLNVRSGQKPGLDVTISGTIILKTEASTAYDVADTTTTAASAMRGLAVAMAEAMKAQAEARLGEGQITLMQDLESTVTGEDGSYLVVMVGITKGPNRVLAWDETEIFEFANRDDIVDATDGSQWVFARTPMITIQHSLAIRSSGAGRGYVGPRSLAQKPGQGSWKLMSQQDPVAEVEATGQSSPPIVTVAFKRLYQFIFSGKPRGFRPSRETTARRAPGASSGSGGDTPNLGAFGVAYSYYKGPRQ